MHAPLQPGVQAGFPPINSLAGVPRQEAHAIARDDDDAAAPPAAGELDERGDTGPIRHRRDAAPGSQPQRLASVEAAVGREEPDEAADALARPELRGLLEHAIRQRRQGRRSSRDTPPTQATASRTCVRSFTIQAGAGLPSVRSGGSILATTVSVGPRRCRPIRRSGSMGMAR